MIYAGIEGSRSQFADLIVKGSRSRIHVLGCHHIVRVWEGLKV